MSQYCQNEVWTEMAWHDVANDRQIAAIASVLKNTAVIAGPGTGKTLTLLTKAVQLIEEEALTGDRIRIVNFTNAGVIDLKCKIATDSKYGGVRADNVSTFHSLALRALSRVSGTAIQRPVVILDDWEEHHLLDQLNNHSWPLKVTKNPFTKISTEVICPLTGGR